MYTLIVDTEKAHLRIEVEKYLSREAAIFSMLDIESLIQLSSLIKDTLRVGGRVFVAGNGGSAATADHFAVDLGVGSLLRGKNFIEAISLSANSSILTALGNDTSFESIFSKQLDSHKPTSKDLVIVISASGNSPNIVRLLECAKSLGVKSFAFTGFDGGKAKEIADFCLHIPTEIGEYGIVEDLHLVVCHVVAEVIRN